MLDRSKPKIGCSSSITNRWTCSSSLDVQKMMFEFVRFRIRSMFDKMVLDPSLAIFVANEHFFEKHVFTSTKKYLRSIKSIFRIPNMFFFSTHISMNRSRKLYFEKGFLREKFFFSTDLKSTLHPTFSCIFY